MKQVAIAALVILGIWTAALAFAPRRRWTARAEATDAGMRRYVSGEVIQVDLEDREIVLRVGLGTGKETPVALNALTRVHYRDVELKIDEIRPGDQATVRWLETDGPAPADGSVDQGPARIAREVRIARGTEDPPEPTADEEADEDSNP